MGGRPIPNPKVIHELRLRKTFLRNSYSFQQCSRYFCLFYRGKARVHLAIDASTSMHWKMGNWWMLVCRSRAGDSIHKVNSILWRYVTTKTFPLTMPRAQAHSHVTDSITEHNFVELPGCARQCPRQ